MTWADLINKADAEKNAQIQQQRASQQAAAQLADQMRQQALNDPEFLNDCVNIVLRSMVNRINASQNLSWYLYEDIVRYSNVYKSKQYYRYFKPGRAIGEKIAELCNSQIANKTRYRFVFRVTDYDQAGSQMEIVALDN